MRPHLTQLLHLLAWTFVALAVVYLAVGPQGALHHHPLAALGVGLIGLGLIVEGRRLANAPVRQPVQSAHRPPQGEDADEPGPGRSGRFD